MLSVFVSYDYDNDRHYKNLLKAWNANQTFDLEFYDQSVDVSVNSDAAGPIRRVISVRVGGSDVFLCIVGKETYKSDWIDWEIKKAVELNKKIVAVKTEKNNISPAAIFGVGAGWAQSFTFEAIRKAIQTAYYGFSL